MTFTCDSMKRERIKMDSVLQELVSFVIQTKYEELPAPVVQEAKYLLLDSIGCALAAISTDPGKMAIALAKRLGGPSESSIIGLGDKVSCSNAVLVNGQLINVLDYEPIMPGGHVPPYVIPPALAMAESAGASGKDLILATVLGYEVAARLTRGVPSFIYFFDPGTHNFKWAPRWGHPFCSFGAAVGAGKLLKLNETEMSNSFGIAGHLCQVLTNVEFSVSEHRPMTKYGVPGWQNTGGVIAVLLAQMGFTGDTTLFDPDYGMWKFCGFEKWDPRPITQDLGKTWIFTNTQYKPYPTCRMLHQAIDCLQNIVEKDNLLPENIESIRAFCNPIVEEPCFSNRELVNIVDTQFNAAYILSVAAHKIKAGVEWQDMETMRNPQILEFMKKVSCQGQIEAKQKATNNPFSILSIPHKVEVVTTNGKTFIEERIQAKGTSHTKFQMTEEELIEKFEHNASRILTRRKVQNATKNILELENIGNISELIEQVTI
jgi:2-methylcitrate dehydratase PrpD